MPAQTPPRDRPAGPATAPPARTATPEPRERDPQSETSALVAWPLSSETYAAFYRPLGPTIAPVFPFGGIRGR